MKKRFWFIAICVLIAALAMSCQNETPEVPETPETPSASVWDGSSDTTWYSEDGTEFELNSAAQLAGLAELVGEGKTFRNKKIALTVDIDLDGEAWTPIKGDTYYTGFAGDFDGQNHTISNLNVDNEDCAGLFATMHFGSVKNLNLDNVTLKTNHYAGAIVAWVEVGPTYVIIDNCKVSNADILAVPNEVEGGYDNGDKVGGIVGFNYRGVITDCTVENASIKAYRDLGGIAGYGKDCTVTGNEIIDVTLTVDQKTNNYGDKAENAGSIVGRQDGTNVLESNAGEADVVVVE